MSALAFLGALALCGALGWGVLGLVAGEGDSRSSRAVLGLAAGMVMLHLALTALQLVGLKWTAPTLIALGLAAFVAGRFAPRPPRTPVDARFGWAEAAALAAVLAFAVAAVRLWIVFPDFVFHWGVKGERFALAGGIDWEFLARSWNWRSHPDYPNLMPELYAVTAILGGREPAMMAWSAVVFGAVAVAMRETLVRSGVPGSARGPALVLASALLAGVGIRDLLAGSSDWNLALAPLLAWPALCGAPSARSDARAGLAAAFAASSKIEGVPLAVLLVGVALARRAWRARRPEWAAVARCAVVPALVVGAWWLGCRQHGLFQPFNTGSLAFERWRVVVPALVEAMFAGDWRGAQFALLALPALLAVRGLRGPALVVSAQLAFYLYVYMSAPIDPVMSIRSTFARFLLHLLPALGVALIVASESLVRRADSCDPSTP